ncbi:hypothetical protein CTA2_3414 [Colletotrichum tanaceti]|uniref:Uncharacterized protein n=1 Tax=Colletotrichum tanaceti TaxID=1306861 RepID=A0A4U6X531_9PEZI|nr:hypothetical protein CTA2_3414 [Colletotrichum tanaceti]TKW50508.1 hypothetical protein CTA1_10713 [Colletotrichum tanaceti]
MDFNTFGAPTSYAAGPPSPSASSSRCYNNTPSTEACRLAGGSAPVSQPDGSGHHAPSSRDGDGRVEKGDVPDVKSDELEASMGHDGSKGMYYAERDDRLLDGYFTRLGSKIQHAKYRKARKLAQRRRVLQDGKS